MKYLLLGAVFFCLGYFIPTLPVLFQYLTVGALVGVAVVTTWYYIDTNESGRFLDEV